MEKKTPSNRKSDKVEQASASHCAQVCEAEFAPSRFQKVWIAFTIFAALILLLYMLVCVCVHH
jgi:hypothetical protein